MLKLLQWFLRYDQVLYPLFLSLFLCGALALFAHFYGEEVFSAFLTGALISLALWGIALTSFFLATHSISWLRDIAAAAEEQEAANAEGGSDELEDEGNAEGEAEASQDEAEEGEIVFTSDPDKPIDA